MREVSVEAGKDAKSQILKTCIQALFIERGALLGAACYVGHAVPSLLTSWLIPMRCPAIDCSRHGPAHQVTDPAALKLPADIIAKVGKEPIYYCSYCQFIWYEFTPVVGGATVRVPIGFYDNFTKPMEFFATPHHRLEEPPKKHPRRRR